MARDRCLGSKTCAVARIVFYSAVFREKVRCTPQLFRRRLHQVKATQNTMDPHFSSNSFACAMMLQIPAWEQPVMMLRPSLPVGQRRVIGHIVRGPPAAMEPETDGCLIFKFIFASDLPQEEQIRGSICFDLSFGAFTRLSFPRGPRIRHVLCRGTYPRRRLAWLRSRTPGRSSRPGPALPGRRRHRPPSPAPWLPRKR